MDVDENYTEKDFFDLDAIKGSDKISDGRIVSFLKPNSKDSLDTVTVAASVYRDRNSINRDSILINYGKSKLMDYIPYQEISLINTSLLKKTLSVIDTKKDYVLSDTVISSYTLEVKNFLDGIEFRISV